MSIVTTSTISSLLTLVSQHFRTKVSSVGWSSVLAGLYLAYTCPCGHKWGDLEDSLYLCGTPVVWHIACKWHSWCQSCQNASPNIGLFCTTCTSAISVTVATSTTTTDIVAIMTTYMWRRCAIARNRQWNWWAWCRCGYWFKTRTVLSKVRWSEWISECCNIRPTTKLFTFTFISSLPCLYTSSFLMFLLSCIHLLKPFLSYCCWTEWLERKKNNKNGTFPTAHFSF